MSHSSTLMWVATSAILGALLLGPGVSDAVPERVYVLNLNSNDVSVIDVDSDTVVGTIPVGKFPHGWRLVWAAR